MNSFHDLKEFIIKELHDKCGINEEEIGLLDSGIIDLMEDVLEFDFCLKNDDYFYTFWHDYQKNIGMVTKSSKPNDDALKEVFKSWGDWDNLS